VKALRSYRSDLDIIADILKVAANGGARKTQILYRANLSYRLLQKYLNDALEARLLRFEDGDKRYVLTSKALQFLSVYKEYAKRNRHVVKQLNDLNDKRRRLKELCSRGGEDENI
jgi:predicted transcriptional regulator